MPMHQQITCSTEPGEENRNGHGVHDGESGVSRMSRMSMASAVAAQAEVAMPRQVQIQVHGATQERDHRKSKTNDETDEVKHFPVHFKPQSCPEHFYRTAAATHAAAVTQAAAFPGLHPAAPDNALSPHVWRRSAMPC